MPDPRMISECINTELLCVRTKQHIYEGDTGGQEVPDYVYRAWIGDRPTISGYGVSPSVAIANLLGSLARDEISYAPRDPVPSIRLIDAGDFRFYREETFRVGPAIGTTAGNGVILTQDDGTYIGFISARILLSLARERNS